MPTRNVVITEHQAALIERLVASGRYQNASEVLREGLRMVERSEQDHAARVAALLAAVEEGEQAIREGRYTVIASEADLDDFMESVDRPE